MKNYEKMGVFYLGKEYDLDSDKILKKPILYDSKDLVTHAVCIGMTGSGKTGLGIGILEEAVIDGIPAIVVDPKGDLTNLLLTFPELQGKDFKPWVNVEEANKKNISVEEYAQQQANLWKNGLADWDQEGERIQRLKDSADFNVFTPGSSAGISVSILESFSVPPVSVLDDDDLFQERINTTVTSLLNLLDIEADPIKSREHILLSNIFAFNWSRGINLDLAALIEAIQEPPIDRIGVFDLESFYPSKDRFELAMTLNNLIASPGFSSWMEGAPLNIDNLYYTENGKPRVSIFSIAHLNDNERMFFVSLLLTQILGWMRMQSGTNSLRALFYMDEIFGYMPPVANPPSKPPLLTMLKQARAFGLGVVLATQNPVDLDYKGLSNIGTWFIGRLQTERDKERVLDGLEGARSSEGGRFDRKQMTRILSALGKRVFLMNNVHEDEPVIFHTRWVMSYLRGPLTRTQIKDLMENKRDAFTVYEPPSAPVDPEPKRVKKVKEKEKPEATRPVLPPTIPQYFMPATQGPALDGSLVYEPMLLGVGKMYYSNAKAGVSTSDEVALLTEFSNPPVVIDWDESTEFDFDEDNLADDPEFEPVVFSDLPDEAGMKNNYKKWSKKFKDWLYRNKTLELFKSPSTKMLSHPGESERDFRVRLQLAAHENRDKVVEKLRKKYATKVHSLEEKIRKAEYKVEREKEQAKQQKLQAAISFGTTILSAFVGRKKITRSTLGRASTAVSRASRTFKESKDIDLAEDNLAELQNQMKELEKKFELEMEKIQDSVSLLDEDLEIFTLKPKKMDISVSVVSLLWVPFWSDAKGGIKRAW